MCAYRKWGLAAPVPSPHDTGSLCRASCVGLHSRQVGVLAGLTHLGAAHSTAILNAKIVTEVGFFREDDCRRPAYHERKPCRRWRPQRRQVHRFPRPWPWRPHYGANYEIYTYRRPYDRPPRLDVQMIYGWYRGYYHPYPYYRGDDF